MPPEDSVSPTLVHPSIEPRLPEDAGPAGIYVHVPFCKRRCIYCGFTTNLYDPDLVGRYVAGVLREMELWKDAEGTKFLPPGMTADTLYFGGGTPSLLKPDQIAALIEACRSRFLLSSEPEVTIEVNPATATLAELKELRLAGVNRASLGVQSLDDEELRFMGRPHSSRDTLQAYEDLRRAGFENISLDLIAGMPNSDGRSVLESLRKAIALGPEHLSIYLLEVKEGTALDVLIRSGSVPAPDDDLAADLYAAICSMAEESGYEQYEISNFARGGKFALHNLKYWQDAVFLGLGPGAHGMTGRRRYANLSDLDSYDSSIRQGRLPLATVTELTALSRFKDAMIMGLRLVQGVSLTILGERYGIDAAAFVRETIGDLESHGLFQIENEVLTLTPRGRLLSNVIFSRWV
jgi:oxygen-independent coproporphyrinogen III oxidase